jgi:hypothetical protein
MTMEKEDTIKAIDDLNYLSKLFLDKKGQPKSGIEILSVYVGKGIKWTKKHATERDAEQCYEMVQGKAYS